MPLFGKSSKQKPVRRDPSRGPASYDSRPRPIIIGEKGPAASPTPVTAVTAPLANGIAPNTLVVGVDFGIVFYSVD
jgi:hypothetical protein